MSSGCTATSDPAWAAAFSTAIRSASAKATSAGPVKTFTLVKPLSSQGADLVQAGSAAHVGDDRVNCVIDHRLGVSAACFLANGLASATGPAAETRSSRPL